MTRAAPQVETVLTIWHDTLNEAKLTVDQSIGAAATLLGMIIINSMPDKQLSHAMLADLIPDVHHFIEMNWPRAAAQRRNGRIQTVDFSDDDRARMPGIHKDVVKDLLENVVSSISIAPPALIQDGSNKIADNQGDPETERHALMLTSQELSLLELALEDMPYKTAQPIMDLIREQWKGD